MHSVDILKDIAQRPLQEAEGLRAALTPQLLNAHPGHDNSPAWLLWHAAREIDEQLSALTGDEPVWTRNGFEPRFGLGLDRHDMGLGHSSAQARAVRVDDAELLLEHLRAVVEAQLAYLDTLSDAQLGEIVDEQWDPPVARGTRLVSISLDALAHVSQAAYVVGMDPAAREG